MQPSPMAETPNGPRLRVCMALSIRSCPACGGGGPPPGLGQRPTRGQATRGGGAPPPSRRYAPIHLPPARGRSLLDQALLDLIQGAHGGEGLGDARVRLPLLADGGEELA